MSSMLPAEPAKIVEIPILPWGMVNAHLVVGETGCILVDTGIPGSEAKIERALAQNGLKFGDIKLIIVTHAHADHAGSAARVRDLSGAPVLAHRDDLDFFMRRRPMTYCPTGWFGRLFVKTPAPHASYIAFEPDILMGDVSQIDLTSFGAEGVVRHTAGHTAGAIAVELASEDALVGDLIASGLALGGIAFKDRAKSPPFEDDPLTIASELERIVRAGARRFHVGHGGTLEAHEVLRHAAHLRRKAALQCMCKDPNHKHA
ncbi:MBL fold metallo-hydrolase [Cupriavidus oxalaticus]|uniref:MBL fold metallo-hydrolase n=1 Tax=Cupriavidus oxalaticus TaxID=96344 RepID=UPI00316C78BB